MQNFIADAGPSREHSDCATECDRDYMITYYNVWSATMRTIYRRWQRWADAHRMFNEGRKHDDKGNSKRCHDGRTYGKRTSAKWHYSETAVVQVVRQTATAGKYYWTAQTGVIEHVVWLILEQPRLVEKFISCWCRSAASFFSISLTQSAESIQTTVSLCVASIDMFNIIVKQYLHSRQGLRAENIIYFDREW